LASNRRHQSYGRCSQRNSSAPLALYWLAAAAASASAVGAGSAASPSSAGGAAAGAAEVAEAAGAAAVSDSSGAVVSVLASSAASVESGLTFRMGDGAGTRLLEGTNSEDVNDNLGFGVSLMYRGTPMVPSGCGNNHWCGAATKQRAGGTAQNKRKVKPWCVR